MRLGQALPWRARVLSIFMRGKRAVCLAIAVALWQPSIAPIEAAPATRIEMEILTEPGLPVGSEQTWFQLLSSLEFANLQVRSGQPGEKVEIRKIAGTIPAYQVIAVLNARNQLLVPGHTFSSRDRAGLAAWLDRLRTAGPEVAGSNQKLPFDLSPAMLAEARSDLRRPLRGKTISSRPWDLLVQIQQLVTHPIRIASADRAELQRSGLVADELWGLSCGTSLAAMLRPAGLAFAPVRAATGELDYRIFAPTTDADIWPIGWPAEDRRRELVPKFFEFVNIEVSDVSVAEAVETIRQRLGIPALYDHNALARHGIDPAAVPGKLPSKRTSYSLALQHLLFQARLKMELRVDEADRPFIWITSIKPLD